MKKTSLATSISAIFIRNSCFKPIVRRFPSLKEYTLKGLSPGPVKGDILTPHTTNLKLGSNL